MYVGRIASMNTMARDYPDVEFLLFYVREAHPGERFTFPTPVLPTTAVPVFLRGGWRALTDFARQFPVLVWSHLRAGQ